MQHPQWSSLSLSLSLSLAAKFGHNVDLSVTRNHVREKNMTSLKINVWLMRTVGNEREIMIIGLERANELVTLQINMDKHFQRQLFDLESIDAILFD